MEMMVGERRDWWRNGEFVKLRREVVPELKQSVEFGPVKEL